MRTCYQSVASHGVIRSWFAEKVYFILLFANFVLVHVIKRISNEFSFHTMYYETRCVFYIPSPEARGYETHNSFHNTSYGMKIHLRSYIYRRRNFKLHKSPNQATKLVSLKSTWRGWYCHRNYVIFRILWSRSDCRCSLQLVKIDKKNWNTRAW